MGEGGYGVRAGLRNGSGGVKRHGQRLLLHIGGVASSLGCPRGSAVRAWDTCTWLGTHQARLMHAGLGVPHKPLGPGAPPKLNLSSCPLPTAPCSPQADPIAPSSLAVAPPCCGVLG